MKHNWIKTRAQFIGNCISNPFNNTETLSKIVDNAHKISIDEFLRNCDVDFAEVEMNMEQYPQDFTFHKSGNIYFYTHSAIETFFMVDEDSK